MATPLKKYTVRPGTIDFGKEYEIQMAALLSLRCVLSIEEDMWLASNPDGVGALDDVVINVKRPGGISLTYMLQLKHKENPKPILEREFLPPSTEGKNGKEDKGGEESKEGEEGKTSKEGKEGKKFKEGKEGKEGEERKMSKEGKKGKECKASQEGKEDKTSKEGKDGEEGKTSKEGKGDNKGKKSKKGKEGKEGKECKKATEGEEGKTSQEDKEDKTSKEDKDGEEGKTSKEGNADKKGKKSKEGKKGKECKKAKEGEEGKMSQEDKEDKKNKECKASQEGKEDKTSKEGEDGEEGKTSKVGKGDKKGKMSKKGKECKKAKEGEEGKTSREDKEDKTSKEDKDGEEGKTSKEGKGDKKGKKGKGAFSLIKYFADIDSLKKYMQSTTKKEDLIQELGKFNNIYFVLFSNRPTETCAFLEPVDNNHSNNLSFINTSDSMESNAYVFNTKQLTESRISKDYEYIKFYLLTNQVNAKCINEKIDQELARIVAELGLTQVNLKELFEKYSKFMTNWAKGDLGGFYCLTLRDVLWKLTALLLSRYELNLKESPFQDCADKRSSIWNEIIRGKSIIFVDSTKLISEFLIRRLTNEVMPYCNKPVKSWANFFDTKATNWFYKTHKDLETEMRKIVGQTGTITLLDLHKCLWKTQRCPLLLEISKEEDYKNIMSILSLSKSQPQIVIINKMANFSPKTNIDQFSSLQDLDEEQLRKVLSQTVKIQGRNCAKLKDLLDKDMFSHVATRDVIDILSNQFDIGTKPTPLPSYFIERSTVKVFLKADVLEKVTDEIFLLTTHSEEHQYGVLEEFDLNNLKMGGVFTIQEVNDDLMKSLASLKQTIHCLSACDKNLFEWKWSSGTTANIKPFREFVEVFEDNIQQYFRKAINIISEVPGMGKSVLLDFIALQAPPNQWVLKIDLNSHHKYFRNLHHSKPSASKYFQYFCEALLPLDKRSAKLNRMIFQKLVKEKNVLILLDGFDEVSVWYKDEVTDMAKCFLREGFKLWLTTRPHMKVHLERELDTFAISLKPFTTHDQTELLIKYFNMETPKSEVSPQHFVEQLLQTARSNLEDRDAILTGIPLQTRLLADFFIDKWKKFVENGVAVNFNEKFDLLKLYRSFIDKKLDTLTYPKIINDQNLFALQIVFPPDKFSEIDIICELNEYYTKNPSETEGLQRNGIMMINEKGDLSCTHKTFAEYLAAEWLRKNFNSTDLQIKELSLSLIKERSSLRYNFLFNIFDRLVAQSCPLHMALLNGHFGEGKKIINSGSEEVFVLDEFRRTALHVATNYNRPDYEFGFDSDSFSDAVLDIIKKLPDRKEFYSNPDALGYTPLDYALNNNVSSIVAEAVYSKINYSLISARLSINDEHKYFMRCHQLNHSLFDSLLPYYISRKLLLLCIQGRPAQSYIDRNTSIRNYLNTINISTSIEMTALEYLQSRKAQLYSGFSNNSYSDIRFALVFGSRENFDKLLSQDAGVNKQDIEGNTALHYAAALGDLETVKALLSKGALSHIRNFTFSTPLQVAEVKRNVPILEAMVSNLVNSNRAYKGRKSLLHYVVEYGNCQDVNKVLKMSDINKADDSSKTPLRLAIRKGKLDVAKLLLANGADVNIVDGVGTNAFHDAVTSRCKDIIFDFPSTSKGINKQNGNGDTPLHLVASASLASHSEGMLLSALVSKGANVNLQNLEGETPIHLVARNYRYAAGDFFKLLLNDAIVNIQDKKGETALHASVTYKSRLTYVRGCPDTEIARNIVNEYPFHIFGNILAPYFLCLNVENETEDAEETDNDIIRLLITKGIDVNIKNIEGSTALHVCIRGSDALSVKKILSQPQLVNINEQDKDGNTYLHLALKDFRLEIILSLIARGINLNIQNNKGETALHVAATRYYYVVVLLLVLGADVDKQDSYGNTALHLALYNSYMLTAELLTSVQSSIDIKNVIGDTALHYACRNGYSEIFDKPICRNVDLNVQNNDGDTPLHIAISFARLKPEEYFFAPDNFDYEGIVRKLISRNVDINMQNANGETALHTAIKKGQLDTVALLLEHKADINMQDKEGRAILYHAISSDYVELAVEIVLKGADINMQDNADNTPLHLACMEERTDIANFLISSDADANLKNIEGRTVFHYASESVFNKLTNKLISEKKGLNRKDTDGNTLLNLALSNGYIEAAKMLLEGKVDVNVKNNRGWTSLHYASRNGYDELVADILSRGGNIDRRNDEDNSSLHLAVTEGHLDVVKLLISKGARVDIVNSPFGEGHTPLHLAVIHNNIDITKILLDNRANAAKLTKSGQSVLHYVKDYEVAGDLISKGADVNAVDQEGNSPLLMVAGNDSNLAKLFLAKGADIDMQNKMGNTPLILASRAGMLSTVTELIFQGADVNIQNNSGDTALMATLERTCLTVTLVLLAFGANINLKNVQQRAALSTAINSALRFGPLNFNKKNRFWKMKHLSKYKASLKQWTSVLKYLVNTDQDLNAQDSGGNTPLHYASMKSDIRGFNALDLSEFHADIVALLLSKGVDLNLRNNDGLTALDLSRFNNTDVTALLLQHGEGKSEEESDSDFSI